MNYIARIAALLTITVISFACSSGSDENAARTTGESPPPAQSGPAEAAPAHAPDIEGVVGFNWGDGTDVLLDQSMYDVEHVDGSDIYSYKGGEHYLEDYGVEVNYEVYEFVDGELMSGEVGGSNPNDMEIVRGYLLEQYGRPQEDTEGLYEWKSSTGTITLEKQGSYWRLTGWSADAPSY